MGTAILNIKRTAPVSNGMREIAAIAPADATDDRIKVAAYARVSSGSEDQLHSYSSQVRHYAAVIKENPDWEYVDVYADEALSGLDAGKRADFQRMMADCRKGKIDRILVKSVSRFARNLTDCIAAIHELKKCGVSVLFEQEKIDTAKMGSEMLLAMHAGKAQQESISISQNTRRGIRMKMKTGDFLQPSVPYGYRLNSKERTMEIEPAEAEVVKRIFAAFLAGQGKRDIVNMLERENILKENQAERRKGRLDRWHLRTVCYILTNITYTGDAVWQKSYTTDSLPFRKMKNNGEKESYYVQYSHPPIISHEDFDAVQRLIAQRQKQFGNNAPDVKNLLKKAVYCECGSLCRRKTIRGIAYWVCRVHDTKGGNICPVRQVPEAAILSAFERMREKLIRHKDKILIPLSEHLKLAEERRLKSDTTFTEVNKELISLAEQVHVLEKLKSKGYLEPALFISQRSALDAKITAARREKARLMDEDGTRYSLAVDDLIAALEDGDPDSGGFAEIAERATIMTEDKIRFRLRCGLEITEKTERAVR
ncbi:MAG: recombinase family protein [Spirochaetaceae bacterium]|jgi:DNA invertase Pin-like site-specific DNA recombinase|nr:recombinase family protein [Spirochaetaceae bacterium]